MKRRICLRCKLAWAEHVVPCFCDACYLVWLMEDHADENRVAEIERIAARAGAK